MHEWLFMICELIYIAVALYYKKMDTSLGLEILRERRPLDQLTEAFWLWFRPREKIFREQIQFYSEKGIQFTYPGRWDYPEAFLKNLDNSPLFLTYLGTPAWSRQPQLGVVGGRKISNLTMEWLNLELFPWLQKKNVGVISGGARGVDQAAHFCALRAKRPTYVFLPSGLEAIYPKEMDQWKAEVLKYGGAYLSEYWPTETIKKYHFIERNRLIAAMSDMILITQGEKKSGTLLTAQWALDLGREIGVLPGHPVDRDFSGNLHLMRAGIPPVMDAFDLESMLLKI